MGSGVIHLRGFRKSQNDAGFLLHFSAHPHPPPEYVTKVCGKSCNFNAVINSKCGTSRRAVKKMIIKME